MLVLDATSARNWAVECAHSLERLRADIDGINVYPVADSDTGSNMLHTLLGACDALDGEDSSEDQRHGWGVGRILDVLARGAVRGARGNSGVILAQVLRGMADSVGTATEVDGRGLVEALSRADAVATAAVARPVDGTMLSVLHMAAAAARDSESADAADVAVAAAAGADHALNDTPRQLPVLAEAGVVDAGGKGLAAVLDALVTTLAGENPPRGGVLARQRGDDAASTVAVPAWEVMYLLDDLTPPSLPALRGRLGELGDSVSVADDGAGTHAVHVHCADIGAAIEAGIDFGRPHRVTVEALSPSQEHAQRRSRGVVALVRGESLADIIDAEGVSVLRVGSEARPSAEDLLGLIAETASEHVTVLPGGEDLTVTAEEVSAHAALGERDVVVVPCASPVQVLSALAVHDPRRRANDDVVAMAEAAAATRRGELRVAGEESLTWVGTAHAGAVLGLVDGEVVLIEQQLDSGDRLLGAAEKVLERMLALGGELVTVLTGAGAPHGCGAELEAWVSRQHPEVEFVSYPGDQDDAVLLIGVE